MPTDLSCGDVKCVRLPTFTGLLRVMIEPEGPLSQKFFRYIKSLKLLPRQICAGMAIETRGEKEKGSQWLCWYCCESTANAFMLK